MPTLDGDFTRISDSILAVLPRFGHDEQRVGLTLYRMLAEGEPVPHSRVAGAAGIPGSDVSAMLAGDALHPFVHQDEQRRVIGFGGLAIVPMHHRFEVAGRALYTWCAWDALFVPEMLGETARVVSPDPESRTPIRLEVDPTAIRSVSHANAVVSILLPDGFRDEVLKTISSFCHYVFFFESPATGSAWTARHPGTFLLSLDQAFELGRRKNAAQFGDALREARAEPVPRR